MTLTTRDPARAARPSTRPAAFRADIQALRALAVGLVVVYHLWPAWLPGGYVGVDVFFVISGYLITAHLWREAHETGTVRLGRFWARRARRLLPSALLVLALTALATVALAPPHLVERYLHEVLAATLYGENWFLAAQSVDYLGASAEASPVMHYWSLSVEEQFYVLLPVLLVATLAIARRMRRSARGAAGVVIVAVGGASLAYSVWLTAASATAYFSTFTRLWEFVAGAALAVVLRKDAARPWVAGVGVAAIVAAAFLFSDGTPFPGYAAALPVVGTMLALAGGAGTWLSRAGGWRPVAHTGRVSYAIYLWHWPLIVLVPFALGRELDTAARLAILVATVALATASTLLVEDPVRFSPRLLGGRAPRIVAAWSVGAMALVGALVAAGLVIASAGEREAAAEAEAALESAGVEQAGEDVAAESRAGGDDAPDEERAPCVGAERFASEPGCEGAFEPGVFVPPLGELEADTGNRSECWTGLHGHAFRLCTLGPEEDFTRHLLVLGDSHSNALLGAYDRLAHERGWRIDLAGHAGCYLTTRTLMARSADNREACADWREQALEAARGATDYDAVVVTRKLEGDRLDVHEEEVDGLVGAWSQVAVGTPVIAILDNPAVGDDFVACLDRAGLEGADACAASRDTSLRPDLMTEAASLVPEARVVDLSDVYCGPTDCPVVIGGVVAYRPDGHHLSATFTRSMAPVLGERIERALADG